jgi:hypothetical protein
MTLPPIPHKRKQLCRKTKVIAFSDMAYGHHHLQTLHNLTSFCIEFTNKASTEKNPTSLQDVKLYNEQAVGGTTDHRTLRNLQKNL